MNDPSINKKDEIDGSSGSGWAQSDMAAVSNGKVTLESCSL